MTTILAETFTNIEEAFKHFLSKVYPSLSKESKEKIKWSKHAFENGRSLTKEKMEALILEYGNAEIERKIIFK